VSRKLARHRTFQALDRATAREGWKIVGLCRLSPIFPFALLNYGFGLTRVPLLHYVFATWIGMMPWLVVYVYVGSLLGATAVVGGPWKTGLRLAGLVVTVIVTVILARIARRALSEKVALPD
jgi:uncharacterized membrane protein YdjX (TVP38/TMEM64 family)